VNAIVKKAAPKVSRDGQRRVEITVHDFRHGKSLYI